MGAHITRRAMLAGAAALTLTGCTTWNEPPAVPPLPTGPPPTAPRGPVELDLADLPPGRYGVWGTYLGGKATVLHDPDDRMRMCSTMKLPLVTFVLDQVWSEIIDLQEVLAWTDAELIGHSPFTSTPSSATVERLCEAAVRDSDNTATNLLIDHVGGLDAMNRYVSSFGDDVTRFDRYETAMNVLDGELDTTTAAAFGKTALAAVGTIWAEGRDRLMAWLPDQTDGRGIAAATPASIEIRHKTGSSGDGAFNDVAILRQHGGTAGCLAIFTDVPGSETDEVVTEIARRSFAALGVV